MVKGEVFYADLSPVLGDELGGIRPVVIVNVYKSTAIVVPLRYHTKASPAERAIFLCDDSTIPLWKLSEQIRTIDVRRLKERAGNMSSSGLQQLETFLESLL